MAIKPDTQLTNFTAATGDYPYGSGKDETAPGNNDGSEYKKIRADDIFGMQQALLKAAGVVPSGNADTVVNSQYLQSMLHLVTAGAYFEDSGAADAYDLAPVTDGYAPAAYRDGQQYIFIVGNTNTSASVVDINGIGAKDIVLDGAALSAGALIAGAIAEIRFDLANDRFELRVRPAATLVSPGEIELATVAETQAGTDPGRAITPASVAAIVASAWVNFNGSGVVAIRDSVNVSSITDINVGNFTVNLTTPTTDANGCALGTSGETSGNPNDHNMSIVISSTSAIALEIQSSGGIAVDTPHNYVALLAN